MNKIKTLISLLLIVVSGADAQIVTLNYNNFSSSDCDVFASPIPVQGILHETKVGDITKNSSVEALSLAFNFNNNAQKGSEFAITYSTFKKDYKYRVKITARNNNSYSEPAGIKCNFNPVGVDFQCNGANFLNANNGTFSASNNWFQIVNGTSFTEYTFESDYLSSAQTNLGIGTYSLNNIGQNSQFNQIIYIKKIEIIELPPPPSFSISPPTVSIPCGDTSARTFTVTPANIPTGANVTYQWSYNNWTELSGSTTTSRTLQPSSGSVLPSSVSVTPYINGVAQTTKTSTVSRASFTAGSLSISGNNYVCDTGQYTINDLPSYISIQSVGSSNTNVATVSLTGSNQITVTKVSDGLATITVLLQNACSQTTTISKQIQVGIPASASNGTISGANYICNNQTYTYTVNGASHPCITSYAWEVSPNLSIISQDVNSITVAQNTFNTAYAGNIKYKIPGATIEISKSIWVGLPNNNELSIDKIGSYDFYVGTWTKLKASYQTLIYANSGEYNFTYEWQIPNSLIRNYTDTAYKDVNPNYSGQLNIGVRAWNECGCSDWKYQLFSVGGGSGNNELTPMKP